MTNKGFAKTKNFAQKIILSAFVFSLIFNAHAKSQDTPPSPNFEGWNKLSDKEKAAVKKHHDELRDSKEKSPTFERKAAKKLESKKAQ